jgi:hypothetical protein
MQPEELQGLAGSGVVFRAVSSSDKLWLNTSRRSFTCADQAISLDPGGDVGHPNCQTAAQTFVGVTGSLRTCLYYAESITIHLVTQLICRTI